MRRHLLVVLGMHRSGTSGLAAMVARAAGVAPMELEPATWEPTLDRLPVVRFNDRLLARLGARWDSIASLPPDWPALPSVATLRPEAAEILSAHAMGDRLAVVADPRLCRLLPFWHGVFADTDFVASFALLVRRPAEIVASLARRSQFAPEKSLALWLAHLCDMERDTRRDSRALFSYDELLADPGGTLDRIGKELSLPLRPTKDQREAATAVVRPELKRERRSEGADTPRAMLASGLDVVLEGAYVRLVDPASQDPFGVIAALPAAARTAMGTAIPPWLAEELALAQAPTRSFVSELDASRRQVAALAQQLEAARLGSVAREKSVDAMREQIARAERDLADERAIIAALTQEVDRARQDARDQEHETAVARASIEKLGAEFDAVRDVALDQQQQLDAARETIDALVAEVDTLRTATAKRERGVEQLAAKLDEHARQLEDRVRREAALLADLLSLRDEATALRSERDALAPALEASQQAQEALAADRDRLAKLEREARERSALLDGRIAALTADVQSLRVRDETNTAELARLSRKWYGRVARRLARLS